MYLSIIKTFMNNNKLIFTLVSIKALFSGENKEMFNQVRNNYSTIPALKSIL